SSLAWTGCVAELMDTSGDLFSKYSSYIVLNKLSKSAFDGIEEYAVDESSLMNWFGTGSELLCLEAIVVSSFQSHLDHLLDNKVNEIHECTPHLVFCREEVHMESCCALDELLTDFE
ncbi:hypothetical protein Tco_1479816, partial [Tanacetum coccineum]